MVFDFILLTSSMVPSTASIGVITSSVRVPAIFATSTVVIGLAIAWWTLFRLRVSIRARRLRILRRYWGP